MSKPLSELLEAVEPMSTDRPEFEMLKAVAIELAKAYDLMRDAACTGLDCDCTASQRLSGHSIICQVPQIEFEINKADETLSRAKDILGGE